MLAAAQLLLIFIYAFWPQKSRRLCFLSALTRNGDLVEIPGSVHEILANSGSVHFFYYRKWLSNLQGEKDFFCICFQEFINIQRICPQKNHNESFDKDLVCISIRSHVSLNKTKCMFFRFDSFRIKQQQNSSLSSHKGDKGVFLKHNTYNALIIE